tara:strand:- start:157 stop:618 length:462 start_codon:yes stop_codon:yes gene_type:complete
MTRYLNAYTYEGNSMIPLETIKYEGMAAPIELHQYLENKYENRENFDILDEDTPAMEPFSPSGPIMYISVYTITRHYGGPEEGGWWYNLCTLRETLPFAYSKKSEDLLRKYLEEKWEDEHSGDIYSVLGGSEMEILVEVSPGKHQDTEVPHYE